MGGSREDVEARVRDVRRARRDAGSPRSPQSSRRVLDAAEAAGQYDGRVVLVSMTPGGE
jgi:hypothetical protein